MPYYNSNDAGVYRKYNLFQGNYRGNQGIFGGKSVGAPTVT